MGVHFHTKEGELATLLTKFKKSYGETIGGLGVEVKQIQRIPTTLFPFDLATGGGFPQGRISIVFGPESSCKTNIALMACRWVQQNTNLAAVFVDVEHTYDAAWAARLGVDNAQMVVLQPDSAEQAVDIVEACLSANDVGIVVVDSIAALTQQVVVEASAERVEVGGNAMIVQRMVKKAVAALSRESKRDHAPALVCINQTRTKIGVMFGNPETMPGGQALKFASSLTVRMYGKDVIKKEVSEVLPAFKELNGNIVKWKTPIVCKTFVLSQCMLEHEGLKAGEVDSWPTVLGYLKDYQTMGKTDKGKWFCLGPGGEIEEYPTQGAIAQRFKADGEFRDYLTNLVIQTEMKAVGIPEGAE